MSDIDVNSLSAASLWSVPIEVNWSAALREEIEIGEFEANYYEAFKTVDGAGFTLVAYDGTVAYLSSDDRLFERHEYDAYAETFLDIDADVPIDEAEWNELFDEDPSMYGVEGPRMSYFYPIDGELSAADAVKLVDMSLCVVDYDGTWGLALTGGGMDMSWHIIAAFVALGMLPPVHFAKGLRDKPDAGHAPTVVAAAMRALVVGTDQLVRERDLLIDSVSNWNIEVIA